MKTKLILFALLIVNIVYGDYYTASNSLLHSDKELIYEDNTKIIIDNKNIKLQANFKTDSLIGDLKAKSYKEVKLSIENKIKSYKVYNFLYMLKNNISSEMFILKTKDKYSVIKQYKSKENLTTIFGTKSYTKIKYIVVESFDINKNKIDANEDKLLTKYLDNKGGLVAFNILDKGLKKIIKIKDKNLKNFLNQKKSKKVTIGKFDFKNEKIYTTYLSHSNSSQKRLNVNYEMSKKNIKITTKSPISLFDPEYKSSSIIEHVALLREVNSDLYELKKVQIVDGSINVNWLNHPKKKVVIVQFENEGKKDKKLFSKSKGQQFYSIESVIYLAHWMAKNEKNEKVFTFVNGSFPFDVTMKKTASKTYEMKKRGNTIYKFVLNNKNIVKSIYYPSYDVKVLLESIDSDTTIKNKKYLQSLEKENNIMLIKE